MSTSSNRSAPTSLVIVAFTIVYLVWGSTYFFIRIAIGHIPALLMACLRFSSAGLLMLLWSASRKESLFVWEDVKPALVSGILLLFLGNGAVVWAEKYLPSSLVAVMASASPFWIVVLDRRNWKLNFTSKPTVIGLMTGFIGVVLLFSDNLSRVLESSASRWQLVSLGILVLGSACWAGGSLYSKYHSASRSHGVTTGWQMLSGGLVFFAFSAMGGEWKDFHWSQVSSDSWYALLYLIVLGSLAGYSAYTWLLKVCTPTQVSTHAYVNPLVAVMLGVWLAGEKMSPMQWVGLAIILSSVVLINLAKAKLAHRVYSPKTAAVACETG